ncbi:MAG: hypothetical protein D8H97_03805, partial [Neisseria sp.]
NKNIFATNKPFFPFFRRPLYISNPNNTAKPSAPAVLFALLFLQISFNNKSLINHPYKAANNKT